MSRPSRRKADSSGPELFIERTGQLRITDKSAEQQAIEKRRVECLGMTFESDEARRAHYLEKLREKLKDPEFRKIEGFPIGKDEDILALSDPPYYTACPNPFISDFIVHYGKPCDPNEPYSREPLAADVTQSRNSPIVNAHSYATKVPPEAVLRYLLHYTEPGDMVLDTYCGTGMVGVASQLAASPPPDLRLAIEAEWNSGNRQAPNWGPRCSIIQDLSPAATFIAANMMNCDDLESFAIEAQRIASSLEKKFSWMYKTHHTDGSLADVDVTLWSDVFVCDNCGKDVIYWNAAVDIKAGLVRGLFNCPACHTQLGKRGLTHAHKTMYDPLLASPQRLPKQVPVLIVYYLGGHKYEKIPDEWDLELMEKTALQPIGTWLPIVPMMHKGARWGDTWRSGVHNGISHIHQFFTHRNLACLSYAWSLTSSLRSKFMLTALMYKSSLMCGPLLSNFFAEKQGLNRGGWVGKERSGTLFRPSIASEVPIHKQIGSRMQSVRARARFHNATMISTRSATATSIPDASIDYVFIDPPFGANRYYSELNFFWEAWLRIFTDQAPEAVESPNQGKSLFVYQRLMASGFQECYRVLKPGRWMTVEFSNTSAAVWNAIQTAIADAGFVVADVRALSKGQGSINAYVTPTAVKQDLVISAYKPNGGLEDRFKLEAGTDEGIWDFIRTHLKQLPVFVSQGVRAEAIVERQRYLLFDRMVAFHVQRGVMVPLSAAEFYAELEQRFPVREGMYFLPEQVAEYERKRMIAKEILQFELFVKDEESAIQWMRQQLGTKPQTFQELHPHFLKEIGGWQKHEKPLELLDLLQESFLRYEGIGDVPGPIHSYLSSNFKELRGLGKDNPVLRAKAMDRWYVPDPRKAGDLEKLRERGLLREFEEYRESKQRQLKVFRIEAVRAGFKRAWQDRDYATIIAVANKIPENVLQEDPKLLMWYDQALTRTGE